MNISDFPSVVGARAEAAVASALVRAGRSVFLPAFSAHERVDLIYLGDNGPVRVQCKTARAVAGAVRFKTCSNTANVPRDYGDEIDEFGVFAPGTGLVYLVPRLDLPLRACTLRLEPTINGQSIGIRWAADYLLGPP